jgi:thiosulfate/3-mercaptopyruvate sulfurtransferase
MIADVRPYEAYRSGHIPGAIHADLSLLRLSSSSEAAIQAWTERLEEIVRAYGFGPGKAVVFYEDYSGTTAAYGVWALDAAGFGNGAMLDGGLRAWHEAGLPVADDDVSPIAGNATIQPSRSVVETAEGILASLGDKAGETQLVDARASHEHAMGAIPGAVTIDWVTHLDDAGAFKPLAELDQLYSGAGLDKEKPVASYCAAGFRAANTYVVLKALGYRDARNYAPSWGEWVQRPDTPVERPGTQRK